MSVRTEQSRFFGRLAALAGAGVPLLRAFESASEGIRSPGLRDSLRRVLTRAYQGSSLTDAFAAEEGLLSPEVATLIEHGERTGDVEKKAAAIADGLSDGVFAVPVEEGGAGGAELDDLLDRAATAGAEAVLLEPAPDGGRVRFRIGKELVPAAPPDGVEVPDLVAEAARRAGLSRAARSRVLWGELDRKERRFPVRRLPGDAGDEVVIRLGRETAPALDSLGLSKEQASVLGGWAAAEEGLVLVAGAPGSGRAEILGALLAAVDRASRKVGIVGDGGGPAPAGVTRYRMDARSLWPGLAHLDVALVPEPGRRRAVGSALALARSGRLVLVPVTARDAGDALAELIRRGADADALAATLVGTVAVARLRGRERPVRVFEVRPCSPELRSAIRAGEPAPAGGALRADADRLVREGVIDPAEVDRVFGAPGIR